jgi:hypothetical protein
VLNPMLECKRGLQPELRHGAGNHAGRPADGRGRGCDHIIDQGCIARLVVHGIIYIYYHWALDCPAPTQPFCSRGLVGLIMSRTQRSAPRRGTPQGWAFVPSIALRGVEDDGARVAIHRNAWHPPALRQPLDSARRMRDPRRASHLPPL